MRIPHNIWVQLRNGVDGEFNVNLSSDESLEIQDILAKDENVHDYGINEFSVNAEGVNDFLEDLGYFKDSEL